MCAGMRAPADDVRHVVVAAQPELGVVVEGLLAGMGVEPGGNSTSRRRQVSSPSRHGSPSETFIPSLRQQVGGVQVVPPRVAREIDGVEAVPAEVAAQTRSDRRSSGRGSRRSSTTSPADRLDPDRAGIEYPAAAIPRVGLGGGPHAVDVDLDPRVGETVARDAGAQQQAAGADVGADRRRGRPALPAAVRLEDLVEQSSSSTPERSGRDPLAGLQAEDHPALVLLQASDVGSSRRRAEREDRRLRPLGRPQLPPDGVSSRLRRAGRSRNAVARPRL